MRNDAERIALVHQRAAVYENRNKLRIWGTVSVCMALLLFAVGRLIGISPHYIVSSGFVGSSLLRENVGGYVLVGSASFTVAVCLTVYCLRKRQK